MKNQDGKIPVIYFQDMVVSTKKNKPKKKDLGCHE